MTELFCLWFLRFSFKTQTPIAFPAGKAANVLRGALGGTLRRLHCGADCPGFLGKPAHLCKLVQSCVYAQVFESGATGEMPGGMADRPRPFLIRAGHLDGQTFETGESFSFDVHLFHTRAGANTIIQNLIEAVAQALRGGIGPRGGIAEFSAVTQTLKTFDLGTRESAPSRIAVEFRTPTELKSQGSVVERPEFGVLFGRTRDRISILRTLYGRGPVMVDFAAIGERAKAVQLEAWSLRDVSTMRRSSRTGQIHSIGGFVGEAQYGGELTEFLPWLHAAEWTGVGRQTVWGKGEIRVRSLETD